MEVYLIAKELELLAQDPFIKTRTKQFGEREQDEEDDGEEEEVPYEEPEDPFPGLAGRSRPTKEVNTNYNLKEQEVMKLTLRQFPPIVCTNILIPHQNAPKPLEKSSEMQLGLLSEMK